MGVAVLSHPDSRGTRVGTASHEIPGDQSRQSGEPSGNQNLPGRVSEDGHGELRGVGRSSRCRCDMEKKKNKKLKEDSRDAVATALQREAWSHTHFGSVVGTLVDVSTHRSVDGRASV